MLSMFIRVPSLLWALRPNFCLSTISELPKVFLYFLGPVIGSTVSFLKSYIEILTTSTQKETLLGDKGDKPFKEVIMLKMKSIH